MSVSCVRVLCFIAALLLPIGSGMSLIKPIMKAVGFGHREFELNSLGVDESERKWLEFVGVDDESLHRHTEGLASNEKKISIVGIDGKPIEVAVETVSSRVGAAAELVAKQELENSGMKHADRQAIPEKLRKVVEFLSQSIWAPEDLSVEQMFVLGRAVARHLTSLMGDLQFYMDSFPGDTERSSPSVVLRFWLPVLESSKRLLDCTAYLVDLVPPRSVENRSVHESDPASRVTQWATVVRAYTSFSESVAFESTSWEFDKPSLFGAYELEHQLARLYLARLVQRLEPVLHAALADYVSAGLLQIPFNHEAALLATPIVVESWQSALSVVRSLTLTEQPEHAKSIMTRDILEHIDFLLEGVESSYNALGFEDDSGETKFVTKSQQTWARAAHLLRALLPLVYRDGSAAMRMPASSALASLEWVLLSFAQLTRNIAVSESAEIAEFGFRRSDLGKDAGAVDNAFRDHFAHGEPADRRSALGSIELFAHTVHVNWSKWTYWVSARSLRYWDMSPLVTLVDMSEIYNLGVLIARQGLLAGYGRAVEMERGRAVEAESGKSSGQNQDSTDSLPAGFSPYSPNVVLATHTATQVMDYIQEARRSSSVVVLETVNTLYTAGLAQRRRELRGASYWLDGVHFSISATKLHTAASSIVGKQSRDSLSALISGKPDELMSLLAGALVNRVFSKSANQLEMVSGALEGLFHAAKEILLYSKSALMKRGLIDRLGSHSPTGPNVTRKAHNARLELVTLSGQTFWHSYNTDDTMSTSKDGSTSNDGSASNDRSTSHATPKYPEMALKMITLEHELKAAMLGMESSGILSLGSAEGVSYEPMLDTVSEALVFIQAETRALRMYVGDHSLQELIGRTGIVPSAQSPAQAIIDRRRLRSVADLLQSVYQSLHMASILESDTTILIRTAAILTDTLASGAVSDEELTSAIDFVHVSLTRLLVLGSLRPGESLVVSPPNTPQVRVRSVIMMTPLHSAHEARLLLVLRHVQRVLHAALSVLVEAAFSQNPNPKELSVRSEFDLTLPLFSSDPLQGQEAVPTTRVATCSSPQECLMDCTYVGTAMNSLWDAILLLGAESRTEASSAWLKNMQLLATPMGNYVDAMKEIESNCVSPSGGQSQAGEESQAGQQSHADHIVFAEELESFCQRFLKTASSDQLVPPTSTGQLVPSLQASASVKEHLLVDRYGKSAFNSWRAQHRNSVSESGHALSDSDNPEAGPQLIASYVEDLQDAILYPEAILLAAVSEATAATGPASCTSATHMANSAHVVGRTIPWLVESCGEAESLPARFVVSRSLQRALHVVDVQSPSGHPGASQLREGHTVWLVLQKLRKTTSNHESAPNHESLSNSLPLSRYLFALSALRGSLEPKRMKAKPKKGSPEVVDWEAATTDPTSILRVVHLQIALLDSETQKCDQGASETLMSAIDRLESNAGDLVKASRGQLPAPRVLAFHSVLSSWINRFQTVWKKIPHTGYSGASYEIPHALAEGARALEGCMPFVKAVGGNETLVPLKVLIGELHARLLLYRKLGFLAEIAAKNRLIHPSGLAQLWIIHADSSHHNQASSPRGLRLNEFMEAYRQSNSALPMSSATDELQEAAEKVLVVQFDEESSSAVHSVLSRNGPEVHSAQADLEADREFLSSDEPLEPTAPGVALTDTVLNDLGPLAGLVSRVWIDRVPSVFDRSLFSSSMHGTSSLMTEFLEDWIRRSPVADRDSVDFWGEIASGLADVVTAKGPSDLAFTHDLADHDNLTNALMPSVQKFLDLEPHKVGWTRWAINKLTGTKPVAPHENKEFLFVWTTARDLTLTAAQRFEDWVVLEAPIVAGRDGRYSPKGSTFKNLQLSCLQLVDMALRMYARLDLVAPEYQYGIEDARLGARLLEAISGATGLITQIPRETTRLQRLEKMVGSHEAALKSQVLKSEGVLGEGNAGVLEASSSHPQVLHEGGTTPELRTTPVLKTTPELRAELKQFVWICIRRSVLSIIRAFAPIFVQTPKSLQLLKNLDHLLGQTHTEIAPPSLGSVLVRDWNRATVATEEAISVYTLFAVQWKDTLKSSHHGKGGRTEFQPLKNSDLVFLAAHIAGHSSTEFMAGVKRAWVDRLERTDGVLAADFELTRVEGLREANRLSREEKRLREVQPVRDPEELSGKGSHGLRPVDLALYSPVDDRLESEPRDEDPLNHHGEEGEGTDEQLLTQGTADTRSTGAVPPETQRPVYEVVADIHKALNGISDLLPADRDLSSEQEVESGPDIESDFSAPEDGGLGDIPEDDEESDEADSRVESASRLDSSTGRLEDRPGDSSTVCALKEAYLAAKSGHVGYMWRLWSMYQTVRGRTSHGSGSTFHGSGSTSHDMSTPGEVVAGLCEVFAESAQDATTGASASFLGYSGTQMDQMRPRIVAQVQQSLAPMGVALLHVLESAPAAELSAAGLCDESHVSWELSDHPIVSMSGVPAHIGDGDERALVDWVDTLSRSVDDFDPKFHLVSPSVYHATDSSESTFRIDVFLPAVDHSASVDKSASVHRLASVNKSAKRSPGFVVTVLLYVPTTELSCDGKSLECHTPGSFRVLIARRDARSGAIGYYLISKRVTVEQSVAQALTHSLQDILLTVRRADESTPRSHQEGVEGVSLGQPSDSPALSPPSSSASRGESSNSRASSTPALMARVAPKRSGSTELGAAAFDLELGSAPKKVRKESMDLVGSIDRKESMDPAGSMDRIGYMDKLLAIDQERTEDMSSGAEVISTLSQVLADSVRDERSGSSASFLDYSAALMDILRPQIATVNERRLMHLGNTILHLLRKAGKSKGTYRPLDLTLLPIISMSGVLAEVSTRDENTLADWTGELSRSVSQPESVYGQNLFAIPREVFNEFNAGAATIRLDIRVQDPLVDESIASNFVVTVLVSLSGEDLRCEASDRTLASSDESEDASVLSREASALGRFRGEECHLPEKLTLLIGRRNVVDSTTDYHMTKNAVAVSEDVSRALTAALTDVKHIVRQAMQSTKSDEGLEPVATSEPPTRDLETPSALRQEDGPIVPETRVPEPLTETRVLEPPVEQNLREPIEEPSASEPPTESIVHASIVPESIPEPAAPEPSNASDVSQSRSESESTSGPSEPPAEQPVRGGSLVSGVHSKSNVRSHTQSASEEDLENAGPNQAAIPLELSRASSTPNLENIQIGHLSVQERVRRWQSESNVSASRPPIGRRNPRLAKSQSSIPAQALSASESTGTGNQQAVRTARPFRTPQ